MNPASQVTFKTVSSMFVLKLGHLFEGMIQMSIIVFLNCFAFGRTGFFRLS